MENVDSEITKVRPAIPTAEADEVAPGGMLGDVRLGELVASGVSSEVYRGENLIARKPCAVKVLHANIGGPVAQGRFSHEARRLASLSHDAVADVYGFGHSSIGRLYGVLEWVEGHVLRDLVRRHAPLPRRNFVPLVRELCAALGVVHASGFAHRRLHGGNVLVQWPEGGTPRIKLLDFGVWHVHPPLDEQGDEPRPAEHAIYLAPELIKGEPGDNRSDIYALGVMLYEMLTGKVPFLGKTFAETLQQHANDNVRPPSELATIPPGIEETVLRALDKDPKRRVPSVEALLSSFDPISATTTGQHQVPAQGKIRALTTGEMKLSELEQVAESAAPRTPRPPSVEQLTAAEPGLVRPVRTRSRRWILFLALGVAVLLFGGAVAYVLLDEEEPAVTKRSPRKRVVRPPARARRPAPARRPAKASAATRLPMVAVPATKQPPSKQLATGRTAPPAPGPTNQPVLNSKARSGSPLAGARLPLQRLGLRRVNPTTKYGTVTLTSTEVKTQFYLDGRFIGGGQRRVLKRVPAGKHKLHALINGRKSPTRDIDLKPDQQLEIGF